MKFVLDINIINGCNMNCSYCFENNNEQFTYISRKTLEDVKEFIKNLFTKSWFIYNKSSNERDYEGLLLNIWGGEPALNANGIIFLLETFKKSRFIEYVVFTNGVFFNEKLKNYLINYENKDNLTFQVSYDGEFLQSKNRKHRKDIETSKYITKNIEFLIKNDIKTVLKSTITPSDFRYLYSSYCDVKKIIKKYNLNCRYSPTIDVYNTYPNFSSEDLSYNLNKIYEDEKKEIRPYFFWNKRFICNSGINYFGIDINGDLYQCHKCFYDKYNKIGHITDSNIFEKILTYRINIEKKINKAVSNCWNCKSSYCVYCSLLDSDSLCNFYKELVV